MVMWMVAGAALVGAYVWYVTLVARRNKVREAMSSVDVHLTQRHDLIPNLLALAGQYMQHERELLAEVTRLRSAATQAAGATAQALQQRFGVEQQLGLRVGQVLARLEAYPDLKAAGPLVEAQAAWVEAEAQITAARRFYNAAVNQLNNAVQMFPGSIIAAIAGVQTMPFFEASAAAKDLPALGGPAGRTP